MKIKYPFISVKKAEQIIEKAIQAAVQGTRIELSQQYTDYYQQRANEFNAELSNKMCRFNVDIQFRLNTHSYIRFRPRIEAVSFDDALLDSLLRSFTFLYPWYYDGDSKAIEKRLALENPQDLINEIEGLNNHIHTEYDKLLEQRRLNEIIQIDYQERKAKSDGK